MKQYNHSGSKILIVDDDATNLKYLLIRLTQAGYEVTQSQSGNEALQMLQTFLPDLILLDIKMPGLDGFEVCRIVKAMEETEDIPIIFLTALTDTIDKIKGFQAGGVDYVTKPINFDELNARINAHLTLVKQHRELKASEAKFQMLADFSFDFEYWLNDMNKFNYVSPSAKRITGYEASDFENDPALLRRIIHPEDREKIWKDIESGFDSTEPIMRQFRIVTKSGEIKWIAHKSLIITDKEGKNYGRRASNQDITTLKLVEDALRQSEQELKAANHSKDEFLSILAHDLKSPFTGLIGLSEMMNNYYNELNSDEIREFSSGIYESAKVIYALIENLLTWTRIQSGKLEFEPSETNLRDAVRDVVFSSETSALKKNITLLNEVEPGISIICDRNMLDMILRNIISNSIKFTYYGGEVRISAELAGNFVILVIKDNGIGITAENLAKLFKMESIISTTGTNKEQGSGMGLLLTKDFVEIQGGTIVIESESGEGTTVSISLPLQKK
ncbi:MAG: response regulator [Ignavibacteria bacterium]|nr:response regulator [Ignavibacteria bacterium]